MKKTIFAHYFIISQKPFIMKKFLLFFVLIVSICVTAQAGYKIQGRTTTLIDLGFKNFTLTINNDDEPISAGSMLYAGEHSIVIVQANNPNAYVFPITINGYNEPIEVRDLQYLENRYILCGSRGEGQSTHAFVAEIDANFTSMDFIIHPEVSVYYSIWVRPFIYLGPALPRHYYACGAKDNLGVIAHIVSPSLQLTRLYETDTPWVYHKIIGKQEGNMRSLIASGRNPNCDLVGFTVFDAQTGTSGNYFWEQLTNPDSHSVLCDYYFANNTIVLASTYRAILTMNLVAFPIPISSQISTYRFPFVSTPEMGYYVQDIAISPINDVANPRISVAGFTGSLPGQTAAWLGSVSGLSTSSMLENYYYYYTANGRHEHYKIRFNQNGETYTGGLYKDGYSWGTLFGTPLIDADYCGSILKYQTPTSDHLDWYPFDLPAVVLSERSPVDFGSETYLMEEVDECEFSKGATTPELIMPVEVESEITTYYDRITVKDIPTNTNYQIYSVTGQLIQTGTTNPGISTAQLNKGVYILRLENGKAYKFVK